MKTITKLVDKRDSEEIQNWENFLLENNEGNVLQSPLIGKVFKRCGFDWNLVITKQDNSIVGGALSTIWPGEKMKFFSKFSTFKTTYGPIVSTKREKEKIALEILKKIEETISKNGGMKHIILTKNDWMGKIIKPLRYETNPFIVDCTFIVNLQKPEDELWNALHKNSTRRYIRKAEKYGVEIREEQSKKAPLLMYRIFKDTANRLRIPSHPISFFESIWENLERKGYAKFFFAHYQGKPVAGLILLLYKKIMYLYIECSLEEASRLSPNKLLNWYAIRWGKEQGYDFYDLLFAPSGKYKDNPSWGLYFFKKNLGGAEIPVFHYEKNYSNIKILLWSKIMIPVYNKVMPLSHAL